MTKFPTDRPIIIYITKRMKRFLRNATMAAAIVLASGSAAAEPTVLLDVDFSETCTAGTEAEPQMFRFMSDFPDLGLPAGRYPPLPEWDRPAVRFISVTGLLSAQIHLQEYLLPTAP